MTTIRTKSGVAAFAFMAAMAFAPGASPKYARTPVVTCLDVYPDHVIVATGEIGERPAAPRSRPLDATAGRSRRPGNDRP